MATSCSPAAADHAVEHGADLAEALEHLAEFAAHAFAGGVERRHRCAGVAFHRFAQRRAATVDLAGQRAHQRADRLGRLCLGGFGRRAQRLGSRSR